MNFVDTIRMTFQCDPKAVEGLIEQYAGIERPVMSVSQTTERKEWEFPISRFVTYEKSDESWCRYAGIAALKEFLKHVPPAERVKAYADLMRGYCRHCGCTDDDCDCAMGK